MDMTNVRKELRSSSLTAGKRLELAALTARGYPLDDVYRYFQVIISIAVVVVVVGERDDNDNGDGDDDLKVPVNVIQRIALAVNAATQVSLLRKPFMQADWLTSALT